MDGFGDPRITVAPQERVADADTNPGKVTFAGSRDKAARVDARGSSAAKPYATSRQDSCQNLRRLQ